MPINDANDPSPDDVSSASDLKRLRPNLLREHFICVKCRKEPRGWAHTAYHIGGTGGKILSGDGVIHGALLCHGDTEEIMITFEQAARYMATGEKIPVFDNVNQFPASRLVGGGGALLG